MKYDNNYFLGLDIGTDSVGYAVTDEKYSLLKFKGKPAWGVTLFDEASLQTDRRSFRSARRRLDRRQQRVELIRELFAKEIAPIDPRFYIRQQESFLFREDAEDKYIIFNDETFTDKEYYERYPTIHHLIKELMTSSDPHDVRLVYLACAWLVAHRGHFLKNIDKSNVAAIKDFSSVYTAFMNFFTEKELDAPWSCGDISALENILKKKAGITPKYKELAALLYAGKKPTKEASEEFPYSRDAILRLLAGGTVKLKDLFCSEAYDEFGSVALGMDDDKLNEIAANIGDDFDLIEEMRKVYDWSILIDALGEYATISEAKVAVYEQHKADLRFLKAIVKKYIPHKYNEVFRDIGKDNYAAYAYHTDETNGTELKKKDKEDFSKYILGIVKEIVPDDEDKEKFADMLTRLELRTFMPKQKETDNRVIPHQLYWYELASVLRNAESYLPFLKEKDEDGLSVSDKILSVFLFRIPYYVGPLNSHAEKAWLIRKAEGRIYPWNFEKVVDFDASEEKFIRLMTNTCTYLPGEPVLPKCSLLYQKFTVLNEINNIRLYGERISAEVKQRLYNEKFLNKKKVTKNAIVDFFICNGFLKKGDEEYLTGIDININSGLSSHIAFKRLLASGVMSETDAERIIERASYAEDKTRLAKWLAAKYPNIPEEDRKYLCSLKLKDFGRLSCRFLCGIEGMDQKTKKVSTIIDALWNTQNNLMELLSDRFTFADECEKFCREYYTENRPTLEKRLDEMYISNAVKRPVYRTLDIVNDVVKAFGKPAKIFVEVTRGADESQKNKRTKTRKQQILELYEQCRDEDVKVLREQLDAMGDNADNKLQGDKLFLYYMQLGKSMYSDTPISLENLGSKEYDIDHIYPQAFVKDDSIINNKVLVLSSENGAKGDKYPIAESIRSKMRHTWDYYRQVGLISEEKYKRLTRGTTFTEEEKYAFINRQLTQTSQSTKAVAALLKERFPEAQIKYNRASLVSEFRQEFDLLKSRSFNDQHHAVDAYLNIVTGNVYDMKFDRRWFRADSEYSLKTKTLFADPLIYGIQTIRKGEPILASVKETAGKNTAITTVYSYRRHHGQSGGLFNQQPKTKGQDLVPLKKGLPTEKYGGYDGTTTSSFVLVKFRKGKKSDIMFFPVDLLVADHFFADKEYAANYIQNVVFKNSIEVIEFPLGLRELKINTVLSLDGYRVALRGGSVKDGRIGFEQITQFGESQTIKNYFKRLERFVENIKKAEKEKKSYHYDKKFDYVCKETNIEIYQIYMEKLNNTIFSKRPNANELYKKLGQYKKKFEALEIIEQSIQLFELHKAFSRMNEVDLSILGGSKNGFIMRKSMYLSNWKEYSDIRIVDSSVSGMWEKQSQNILELL